MKLSFLQNTFSISSICFTLLIGFLIELQTYAYAYPSDHNVNNNNNLNSKQSYHAKLERRMNSNEMAGIIFGSIGLFLIICGCFVCYSRRGN